MNPHGHSWRQDNRWLKGVGPHRQEYDPRPLRLKLKVILQHRFLTIYQSLTLPWSSDECRCELHHVDFPRVLTYPKFQSLEVSDTDVQLEYCHVKILFVAHLSSFNHQRFPAGFPVFTAADTLRGDSCSWHDMRLGPNERHFPTVLYSS